MTTRALAIAALLSAAAAPANPPPPGAVFNERVAEMVANRGEFRSYQPREIVPGVANAALPRAAKPTISADALKAARDYAGRNNSSAYMVIRNGRIEDEAYFGKFDATTPIVSKSLAKPITALAVGRALALGKIKSLDQSVADFIPQWRGKPQAAMKIRHLLDMRTGLLAQNFENRADNHWNRAYLDPDHIGYIIEHYPLTDTPGSIYEYANSTSEMVAPVIEAATGRRYAEFVGNEVLKPIGAPGGEVWLNRPGGVAHAGCCTMLPAQSWARMAMLVLSDGKWNGRQLLPKGYVREMMTGTPQNPYYGLGLWLAGTYTERRGFANPARPVPKTLHGEPYLAKDIVLFDGNSNQVVYIVPSAKLIILRTGDSPPRSPEWDNAVLPNTLLRGMGYKGPAQPR